MEDMALLVQAKLFCETCTKCNIPNIVDAFKDINDSLCMLLPVFNYLNLMRDLITDKFKVKTLQKAVKDRSITGDKLIENGIADS